LEEFNQDYVNATVVNDSVWIPLLSLPVVSDDKQHHIAYRTGSDVRFASAEPEPVNGAFDGSRLRAFLVPELESPKNIMDEYTFTELRSRLVNVLKAARVQHIPELPIPVTEDLEFREPMARGYQILRDIAYLSRTFFGAEFLLAHEQQK
jgi:hypothetical protein